MNQAAEVGDASSDTSDIDEGGSSKVQSEFDWDDDVLSLGSPFASTSTEKSISGSKELSRWSSTPTKKGRIRFSRVSKNKTKSTKPLILLTKKLCPSDVCDGDNIKEELISADNVCEYIYLSSNSNSSDDVASPSSKNDVLSKSTQLSESSLSKECNSRLTHDNEAVSEVTFAKRCDQPKQSACIDSSVERKRTICADPENQNDDFLFESETKVDSPPSTLSSKSSSYMSSSSSTNGSSNKSTLRQTYQGKTLDNSKVKGSKKYTDSVQETEGGVDGPSGASREHSAGVTGTSDVHIDKRLKPTPFQMVLRRRRTEDTIKNKPEEAKVILKGMGRGRGKHFER